MNELFQSIVMKYIVVASGVACVMGGLIAGALAWRRRERERTWKEEAAARRAEADSESEGKFNLWDNFEDDDD